MSIIFSFTVKFGNVWLSNDGTLSDDLCKVKIPDLKAHTLTNAGNTLISAGRKPTTQFRSLRAQPLTLELEFMTAPMFNLVKTMMNDFIQTGAIIPVIITGELTGQLWEFDAIPAWRPEPLEWADLAGSDYEKVKINLIRI